MQEATRLEEESSDRSATTPDAGESLAGAVVPRRPLVSWSALLTIVLLAALRLALAAPFPFALADQRIDDLHYLELAGQLDDGNWLGPYNERTLIKEIGFPLFIAACHRLGIPLRLGQELAWILACTLVFAALRRLRFNWLSATLITGILLVNPASLPGNITRVVRESLYNAQVLAIIAMTGLCLGTRAWRGRLPLFLALALTTVWTWHSREEGIWLLAILVPGFLGMAYFDRLAFGWRRAGLMCAVAVLPIVGLDLGFRAFVEHRNEERYGRPVFVETKSDTFRAAVGAVIRAEEADEDPYFPVHQETLERLYPVSPSLARIRATLDSSVFRIGWMAGPRGSRPVCAFAWALRAGAHQAGYFSSLGASQDFFQSIADEVNAHLDQIADAGPERASVFPPLNWQRRDDLFRESLASLRELWKFDMVYVGEIPDVAQTSLAGPEARRYGELLGQDELPEILAVSERKNVLRALFDAHRRFLPHLAVFAVAGLAIMLHRRRRLHESAWFLGILASTFLARALLVGGLEVWYCPSRSTYLLCAMPPFALFALAGVAGGLGALLPDRVRDAGRSLFDRRFVRPVVVLGLALAAAFWGVREAQEGRIQEVPRARALAITQDLPAALETFDFRILSGSSPLVLESTAVNPSINLTPWYLTPPELRFDAELKGRIEGYDRRELTFVCYGESEGFRGEFRVQVWTDEDGRFEERFDLGVWGVRKVYLGGSLPLGSRLELERLALVPAR